MTDGELATYFMLSFEHEDGSNITYEEGLKIKNKLMQDEPNEFVKLITELSKATEAVLNELKANNTIL